VETAALVFNHKAESRGLRVRSSDVLECWSSWGSSILVQVVERLRYHLSIVALFELNIFTVKSPYTRIGTVLLYEITDPVKSLMETWPCIVKSITPHRGGVGHMGTASL